VTGQFDGRGAWKGTFLFSPIIGINIHKWTLCSCCRYVVSVLTESHGVVVRFIYGRSGVRIPAILTGILWVPQSEANGVNSRFLL